MESASEVRVESGQSGAIDKLAAALVAAQGEMTNPPKSKTVYAGQKRYSFAPLPEIIDCARPVLKKHGLAVVQLVRERALETRLVHQSGQWIGATYGLPSIADSQAMGSAITYARRYSLCAILGIAAEDDEDGEAATEAELAEQAAKRQEAEKRLDALKGKGLIKSAHDGKVLAPGESALPAERAAAQESGDRSQNTEGRPGTGAPEVRGQKGRGGGPGNGGQGPGRPTPTANGKATPAGDALTGIAQPLADLMRRDGITVDMLKRYYVGKRHLPESVAPTALPADYVAGLTKPENWKRAVAGMKGGK